MSSVLLVNYEYPPIGAGAANATYNTALALVKLGIHPVVVTAAFGKNKGITEEAGVTVIRIPALRRYANKSNVLEMASYMVSLTMNLYRIYKRHQIDRAIVYFSFPCGPIGLFLYLFFDTRYIVLLRGGDVPGTEPKLGLVYWVLTPLRRLVFRFSQAVVANSDGLASLSMKTDPYIVKVIPNGVNTDYWHPVAGTETGQFKILFVGRLHSQKNVSFLLDEFATFRKCVPNSQLTIVGDGPDRNLLEQQAVDLGIDNNIIWYGWASKQELRGLYQASDCLINPSVYEGMPNVVLEAMASGIPVLASDCIGNSEIIEDLQSGFLFQLDDSPGFQKKLLSIYNHEKKVIEMTISARNKMVNSFSWESVAQQYLGCFA
jgi:glycosyltransferase involved in cell wall biosynthesis